MDSPPAARSSNRILYDVPCVVCQDHSSGKHYGVYACDGCAGFFKRSVRRQRSYTCTARTPGRCLVDRVHRNQCRSCRLDKCFQAGMNPDAVQHERGPRNSTIRRQMALFVNDRITPNRTRLPIRPVPNSIVPTRPILPTPPLNAFNPFLYSSLLAPTSFSPPRRTSPVPVTSALAFDKEVAEICEAAAKLLFMNVKWAKGMDTFEGLSIADRFLLLSETWKDLFVVGAAQFLYPTDLKKLSNRRNMTHNRDFEFFLKTMADIAKLKPDSIEYNCLRGIMLYNVDTAREEGSNLQDLRNIAAEQDRQKIVLHERIARTHPLGVSRTDRFLELLPNIRQVSSLTIVDLFFRATIQNIAIGRIICDMYKTA